MIETTASKPAGSRTTTTIGCLGSLGFAGLCGPMSLAFEHNGDMLIADSLHNRVVEHLSTGNAIG